MGIFAMAVICLVFAAVWWLVSRRMSSEIYGIFFSAMLAWLIALAGYAISGVLL